MVHDTKLLALTLEGIEVDGLMAGMNGLSTCLWTRETTIQPATGPWRFTGTEDTSGVYARRNWMRRA